MSRKFGRMLMVSLEDGNELGEQVCNYLDILCKAHMLRVNRLGICMPHRLFATPSPFPLI
jgi:hypothetical protein